MTKYTQDSLHKDPTLLAKSDGTTLFSHLLHTFEVAKAILDQTELAQLTALKLDPEHYGKRFRRLVLIAAAIHDLGKANTCFQNAVRGGERVQPIRHEWILYILLRKSPLGEWLRKEFTQNEHDFDLLVWAVTGHHRKICSYATHETSSRTELLAETQDFRDCLDWITSQEGPSVQPCSSEMTALDQTPWKQKQTRRRSLIRHHTSSQSDENETLRQVFKKPNGILCDKYLEPCVLDCDSDETWAELSAGSPERRLLAAVRSTLMAADVTASAAADGTTTERTENRTDDMEKNGDFSQRDLQIVGHVRGWVDQSLNAVPHPKDYQILIDKKRKSIENTADTHSEISRQRYEFQEKVASSNCRVTLVRAGCGSGKTLAAYQWAARQCPEKGARLCFCYPTTGTATEGFIDYLIDDQVQMGKLAHSRVDADFQIFDRLQNLHQEPNNSGEPDEANELASIMRSLRFWEGNILCCTVDTVLGFLVNTYSGHLAWPAIAQSLFVFDEIHSYDDTLFGWLLEFLKTMCGAKILLMTASLPEHRLKAIEKALKTCDEKLQIIDGPKAWEQIQRYKRMTSDGTECQKEVEAAVTEAIMRYRAGEKVLWICNTVGRAINTAKAVEAKLNPSDAVPIVYHSHYKYEDRVKRHNDTIKAFHESGGVICITTQVAEMSLDISADFLLTEIAPIPAMIQRLGRLNRRTTTHAPAPFMVIPLPENDKGEPKLLPYSRKPSDGEWFNQTNQWLESLGTGALSQADLARCWSDEYESARTSTIPDLSPWLKIGLREAIHTNLRDINSGCEVVLEEDLAELDQAILNGSAKAMYTRFVIPMTQPPKQCQERMAQHPKFGCFIAKNGTDIQYDEQLGGTWIRDNA